MIKYESFTLSNGLRVVVHPDFTTSIAAVNIIYDVGARDENPELTGFAHLFEHLMFEGSVNISSYDKPVQEAGGTNNAFTSNDITNYYLTLPAANIETAFWLESDRMLSLAFSQEKLDIQKKVVVEEFKERYINQPYGDVWQILRELCYKVHPYRWPTIGKDISHVESAKLDDVIAFFKKYYIPANAVLTVAGPVTTEQVRTMAEKWFGPIPAGTKYARNLPVEPEQLTQRRTEVTHNVPHDMIYIAWPAPALMDPDYKKLDLVTEILGFGETSRLYQKFVKKKNLFSSVAAYMTGSVDPGLAVISARLSPGISLETAENALLDEVNELSQNPPSDAELTRLRNKAQTADAFEKMNALSKAMKLSMYTLLGDTEKVNTERTEYDNITPQEIKDAASKYLKENKMNVLFYRAQKL